MARLSSRSLIIAILAFDLLVFIAANTDFNLYRYDTNDLTNFAEREYDIVLRKDLIATDRRKRETKDASVNPQPPISYEVPSKSPQDTINNNKSNAPSNVTYATENSTATVTPVKLPAGHTDSSSTTLKPITNGKKVIVSTPIVPSQNGTSDNVPTVQPTSEAEKSKVHVWANQTRWTNLTEKAPVTANETDLDDFAYPTEITNKTLRENNISKSENDKHQYYNSSFITDEAIGKSYWIDLDKHEDIQVNQMLSKSHRRAATIKLKFDFPFYGHKVRNITIATGGFLYTGEYVHSWLAATQYIAPLMANFDTTLSAKSFVKYADNGTAFTVEWENVHLQDKPEAGAFTFQVTLLQNGDIIFVYKAIPVLVEKIEDKEHPVKIGLSDAYMMDRTVFFARRKTIYEYHRVNFNRQDIKNWTVIYLKALPTCLQMDNCNDCLTKIQDFDCKWCPELQKCSTGTFRFRQEWLQKGCDTRNIREEAKCPARSSATVYREHPHDARIDDHRTEDDSPTMTKYSPSHQAIGPASSLEHSQENMNMGVSGIIGVLFVITLIAGMAGWATYAYRNPHSASGQMLIRYRPSQWSWRRGEARYTAATIHM